MPKDYYLILGITADSTREDIRAAFRHRALELHPDRSGLGSEPFREAQEAYQVLSDPERRRAYDREYRHRSTGRRPPRPMAEPLVPPRSRAEPMRADAPHESREIWLDEPLATYRPSFDELFDRIWSNFESVTRPKAEQLESLTVEIVLSTEEAAWGGSVRVWVPARATCPACGGQGAVGSYECWRCEGHGAMSAEYLVDVEYPGGVPDGYAIRIPLARFGIENMYLTVLFRVAHFSPT